MKKSAVFLILSCAAGLAGLAATVFYLKNREKKSAGVSRLRGAKSSNHESSPDIPQNPKAVQQQKNEKTNLAESSKKTVWIPKTARCGKLQRCYEGVVRLGHVGKNFYYAETVYCRAENAREAAKIFRNFPRVKHHHKFAIFSVKEISEREFLEGCRKMRGNPFFKCHNPQEQRNAMGSFIFENRIPEEPKFCFKKKHTLRSRFNEDETYELLKNFCGDLTSEEIA